MASGRVLLGGDGTQNAALAFGGAPGVTATEEYNGTAWSPGGNLATGRDYISGAGTQNAGLAFGGLTPSLSGATEEYTTTEGACVYFNRKTCTRCLSATCTQI